MDFSDDEAAGMVMVVKCVALLCASISMAGISAIGDRVITTARKFEDYLFEDIQ